MSETKTDIPAISSLAAPTEADLAVLRALSPEERKAVIAAHIAQGSQDITEGRFVSLESDDDISAFFDAKLAKYEA
ncbi:MAG: hypothetical protein AAGA72_00425 [Pseudomonadota bacterium]